ncbi:HVO_A0114 family putative DNA-binding protein [Agrobacterium pusense]|uniref:HVO_A0114 family putative DNA-binding protein n=1 Tax=Agrobacterium pusense TaxID=648995 RepID=UPI003FD4A1B6
MKEAFIQIRAASDAALNEVFERATNAMHSGNPSEPVAVFTFSSPAQLFSVITPKRWELIEHLQKIGPSSIRGLARSVDRDVKRIHEDVSALSDWGIRTNRRRKGSRTLRRHPREFRPQSGSLIRDRNANHRRVNMIEALKMSTARVSHEVHRLPNVLQTLRGLIDRNRRRTAHRPVPATRLGFHRSPQTIWGNTGWPHSIS